MIERSAKLESDSYTNQIESSLVVVGAKGSSCHRITTMVGRTVAHYLILEKIGAGGMGIVYRARDTQLERLVALKVVGENAEVDQQAQARLMREARTASVLNHSNICTRYEAG